VLVYWWGSGFAEPGTVVLALLVFAGIVTWAVDWLGGVVGARVGGASMKTAIAAGLVGLILLRDGPRTHRAGAGGRRHRVRAGVLPPAGRTRFSAKAAAVTTAAMLGSAVVQALLTGEHPAGDGRRVGVLRNDKGRAFEDLAWSARKRAARPRPPSSCTFLGREHARLSGHARTWAQKDGVVPEPMEGHEDAWP